MRISIQELLLVFIVALVVLGPDKLPVYARKLGEALKEFRRLSADATKDIRESIVEPLQEAQRPLREALEPVTSLENDVNDNIKEIRRSLSDIGKPVPAKSVDGQPPYNSEASDTDASLDDSKTAEQTLQEKATN